MSKLAWDILRLLIECEKMSTHYLAAWTIGETLQLEHFEFHWQYPQNDQDRAMKELIDRDLIEELPDLGQRFRLKVT